ncbi:MAG: SEC-C metal-binding domain-containing protein [Thermoguttaceae bacterium]
MAGVVTASQQQEGSEGVGSSKGGRNAPCPCGSGKKYKNCCMKKSS